MINLKNVFGAFATVGVFGSALLGLNANDSTAGVGADAGVAAEVQAGDDDASLNAAVTANVDALLGLDDVDDEDLDASADVSADVNADADDDSANLSLGAAIDAFLGD